MTHLYSSTLPSTGETKRPSSRSDILFCPLASGSKGNAIFFQSPHTSLLFDAGLSAKAIIDKLKEIGKSIHDIDGIVISHEHHDHIAGVKAITSKYNIPLITNYSTAEAIVESLGGECPQFHIFTTGEPFEWHDIEITPFSVQHDGVDPVAFTLRTCEKKIAICTDLGFVTSSVKHHLKLCDIIYIEANHKPEMVHASARSETYKKRVLSRIGHLSNEECARLMIDCAHSTLDSVYLAHLSSECNSEEAAHNTVQEALYRYSMSLPLSIAYQHKVSKVTKLTVT